MITIALDDNRLTGEQQSHVNGIAVEFATVMADKYVRGQVEHGGNLWDLTEGQLLDAAIDEAIDQVTYLLTLRAKRLEKFRPPAGSQR